MFGGKMELLTLSKFKLQLRALISDVRELREREHGATEQLHLLTQKQKQAEEEYNRKFQELQAELASSKELRQKLERKVKFLQNDNELLENKHKELKGTIDSLLQSRENFMSVYEESTCEIKRSIETRDRKLAVLSEKLQTHLSLFDFIQNEVVSVKHIVDNAQRIVSEKEETVAILRCKMDKISTFEREFIDKISFLENKLRNTQDELKRKNINISELEEQLEAAKISDNFRLQVEDLQKALTTKDVVIQNLIAERKALRFEILNSEIIFRKVQDAVTNMKAEDKEIFSSVVEDQEKPATMRTEESDRVDDYVQKREEHSPCMDPGEGASESVAPPECQQYNSVGSPLEKFNHNSCVSESACSDSRVHVFENYPNGKKDNCSALVHQLDSEGSTTAADLLKDTGDDLFSM